MGAPPPLPPGGSFAYELAMLLFALSGAITALAALIRAIRRRKNGD